MRGVLIGTPSGAQISIILDESFRESTALRQSLIGNVGKAHRVGRPGVYIHASLATGALYQHPLALCNLVVLDGNQLQLDVNITRIMRRGARGISDVDHLFAIR